jgi:hypothetical protein
LRSTALAAQIEIIRIDKRIRSQETVFSGEDIPLVKISLRVPPVPLEPLRCVKIRSNSALVRFLRGAHHKTNPIPVTVDPGQTSGGHFTPVKLILNNGGQHVLVATLF